MNFPWKQFRTLLLVCLLAVCLSLAAVQADALASSTVGAETHLVFLPFTLLHDGADGMGSESGLDPSLRLPEAPEAELKEPDEETEHDPDEEPDDESSLDGGGDGAGGDSDEDNDEDNGEDDIEVKITYCPAMKTPETRLAGKMGQDLRQQRKYLHCDLILTQVARARAEDMGRRGYVDHQTPEALGPNELVIAAGYPLPEGYGQVPGANNIESIAAGPATVAAVWTAWMTLSNHWQHLLGLEPFYAEQVNYGIGYFYLPNSPYGHYWVVLTAPPAPDE